MAAQGALCSSGKEMSVGNCPHSQVKGSWSPAHIGPQGSQCVGGAPEAKKDLLQAPAIRMRDLPPDVGCLLSSTRSTHSAENSQRSGGAKGHHGQALSLCLGHLEFKAQATSSLLQYPGGPAMHTPRDARQPLHLCAEGE